MALLSDAAITALRYLRAADEDPRRSGWVDVDEAATVLPSAVRSELVAAGLVDVQSRATERRRWSPATTRTYAAITERGRERLRRIEGARARREMAWE